MVATLAAALVSATCGGNPDRAPASGAGTSVGGGSAGPTQAAFTEADLDKLEGGLRTEIDAVKAAQQRAATAATAEERGQAIQAQWDTATIPLGAEASGLSPERYRDVRAAVNQVFTTLDFQGKIDGPMSIDLQRADAQTKARVSGDAFAELPAEAARALRARMDRLVPLWIEYTTLVAVAG
jgi:hypothetical protein